MEFVSAFAKYTFSHTAQNQLKWNDFGHTKKHLPLTQCAIKLMACERALAIGEATTTQVSSSTHLIRVYNRNDPFKPLCPHTKHRGMQMVIALTDECGLLPYKGHTPHVHIDTGKAPVENRYDLSPSIRFIWAVQDGACKKVGEFGRFFWFQKWHQ